MVHPHSAFAGLVEVLVPLDVPYHVGGSAASSAYGLTRSSVDVDFVVDIRPEVLDEVVARLRPEFGDSSDSIREMFSQGRSAVLVHRSDAAKLILFPLRSDDYSRTCFGRSVVRDLSPDGRETIRCRVASAEDTILSRLVEWHREGDTMTCAEWSELRTFCEGLRHQLDAGYLRQWGAVLKVDALLERLLTASGL